MQLVAVKFTKNDLAKYPFLKETTEYVKKLDLKIEDLTSPEFANVLARAEERVEEAILYATVNRELRNTEIEILSFPAAIMLTVATEVPFIKSRYALAEAKQIFSDIQLETNERILALASNFGWGLRINNDATIPYEFTLNFADYLRNTTHLREKKWKLVNRLLDRGKVYLTKAETARLLSEEARNYFETRLKIKEPTRFPTKISEMAEKIKQLYIERIGKVETVDFPKVMVQSAFPPCVKALYETASSGRHLSHVGRFTLTSFLINIGMTPENVNELFKNFSDYNERMTRYQVEHIAGERGSRTRYTPPRCETLRTHGVCTNPDELCQRIRHPLAYYKRETEKNEG
ncbi:MAG: hypothetical protein ACUVUE_02315 [Candidatus Bathycorpusculaceae bacterium]